MRAAAILVLLSGCALYSGDDDAPADVDAAPADVDATGGIMAGNYRAVWSCQTPSVCANPLTNDVLVSVSDDSAEVRISWAYEGALAPTSIHIGQHATTFCADMPSGLDEGQARDGYQICLNPAAPAPALQATIAWGPSIWRCDLTRL